MTGPYADAANAYWSAGWRGILPLPERKKKSPPTGYTGEGGLWPSYADVHTWVDSPDGTGNIALRLPRNIVGLDVDAYGDKAGAITTADAEKRMGDLPPTWRTTSRDDGISGIRLFIVPEGLRWPGELGPGTEIIRHGHRYAVVWPSIHPEGRTYRWINPEGVTSTAIPDPDSLPTLPVEWIAGLTDGQLAVDIVRNTFSNAQTRQWILGRPDAPEHPCARMSRALEATLEQLRGGSAHGAAASGVLRLIRLADEGHAGVLAALTETHRAFVADVTSRARSGEVRSDREAEAEWARALSSAVNLVTANPTGIQTCDCSGQLTGLIVAGGYPVAGTAALAPLPRPVEQEDPEPAADSERQHTSWWPRNLADVIAGREDEPGPTHLARTDGVRLFYAGKVNAILGESESGKTWVALLSATQALAANEDTLYLDFEDTAAGIIARLRSLGATDNHLDRLHYIGPDETLHAAASEDLRDTIDRTSPSLIILDGWNAAMTLLGLDLEKNKDATTFAQLLLKPLAASGATVVAIDHLPKNKENRGKGGIGAQAKRAMMTGCAILVDVENEFGRGMTGRLKLFVDKDRPGHVRAASAGAKRAGTAVLESDGLTGQIGMWIEPPDAAADRDEEGRFRPTVLMERVSRFLESCPDPASTRDVIRNVTGKEEVLKTALHKLVEEGYVDRESGSRNGVYHHSVKPFREHDLPPNPTDAPPTPGDVLSDPRLLPPSLRGEAVVGGSQEDLDLIPDEPNPDVACDSCFRPTPRSTHRTNGGVCKRCAEGGS